jgi:hypothetical protein
MPALAGLLATGAATAEQLLPAALRLLQLLLQQDKTAAVDALKCEMLPALAAVYERCCASGMKEAAHAVLLLLFKPPVVPSSATVQQAPATGSNKRQLPSSGTTNTSKAAGAAAGMSHAAALCTVPGCVEAGECLQDVQLELGRCCSTATVQAAMQLMSQGEWRSRSIVFNRMGVKHCKALLQDTLTAYVVPHIGNKPALSSRFSVDACACCCAGVALDAELALQLLKMLLAATSSSQEARTAAHAHSAGMAAALLLATSAPTPAWSEVPGVSAEGSAVTADTYSAAAAAQAAADLLVQVGEEKHIKPLLAQPLAQVCMLSSGELLVSRW